MATLGSLLSDLYRDLNFQGTPAADVTTRLTAYLNKSHQAILREPSLLRLRDTLSPLTFASVASQAIYGLPSQLARVYAVSERDNDRDLQSMTLADLRAGDPGLTSSGTPWAFVPLGYGPTKYAIATTGVWVASSDAADTTQVARVDGVRSGGLQTGDQTATLTGTTRVQIGSFTDYVDIQAIIISAVGVGLISFYDASSSGNTLAEIPIGATSPRYFRVQLFPTPASAITYYVDGQLHIPSLAQTNDVPMLPEEFHDMLAAYARMREYERLGDDARMSNAGGEYELALSRLKHMIGTSPSEVLVMGQPARRRFSRYGAWAPAESW